MIRKFVITLSLISGCSAPAIACLDCSGTGSNATFTGVVTASVAFIGPTISTITERLSALEQQTATGVIRNQNVLQDGATAFPQLIITSSITSWGTVMSTGGFVGDGSKLTGITVDDSTSSVIYDFRAATANATTAFASSASYMNIMGCYVTNFSSQVDLAKIGAGGVPVGDTQDATARWWSIWAIADTNCTASGMIASTFINSNRPKAMPDDQGWTKWRLLTYVRADSSEVITGIRKTGRQVYYVNRGSGQDVINSGSPSTVLTDIDGRTLISTAAVAAHLTAEGIGTGAIINVLVRNACQGVSAPQLNFGAGGSPTRVSGSFSLPLCYNDPGGLKYLELGAESNINIQVDGYEESVP